MHEKSTYLSIGETARRSGVAASTLRFYESRGLIHSVRGPGNHRRYHRAMLRKISLIRIAQNLGISLKEIGQVFETLPDQRVPNKKDWGRMSRRWHSELDQRIQSLQSLRDQLTGCIGCGCLSLKRCSLYNPGDNAESLGAGARYLLGDSPDVR